MSGAKLCALLSELGFEGHDALDPDSFEWPFQYEDARPILDWICSSLRPSNVLSASELKHLLRYEQFVQDGKLLEGEDLDFAYESISAFSTRRDNQEAVFGAEEGLKEIRDATLSYKAEAVELQRQLGHLQSQYDMLSTQASTLIQGKRARVASTSTVNGLLTTIDDSLSARNLEMNAVLGRIASTAQELARFHSGDEDGIYLAYSDFHPYLLADSSCMKELNQWFVKQLDTGPYRMVAEEGKSKCSWVNLDDVSNTTLVRADSQKSHQRVSELQRLRSIFGTSERQWVEAQVENAKQQAILVTLKGQVNSDEAHIHLDLHSLRRKHVELAGELSNLQNKEEKLLSETIPNLCWELAQLQDTYILQGDYDLKVMRQEYYIQRQKTFISHLINQLARHQFLKLACQFEKKTMLGAFSLLKVIESELQGYLSATKGRVGRCLALIEAASDVQEQGAVDDRDTFLHGVRDLLSIHSNTQGGLSTYVSAPGLVQQISSLQSDLMVLQSDLDNALPEDRSRCINELCTLIQSLQQLLFASSTTAQPILTPRTLMKELDEMEKMNAKLSAAVEEVTHEHNKKNEIVKHHSQEMALQRQVFVDFFCNPDRLRNQVRELTARVRALQAS
ncbi:putative HAUS augmin-like complex subunit 3 [Helianthus annuus]|nr:putative HAUS augmin-like complex subunit 3 [Helianthus annuus]KAJ0625679.1 putative HAUS augmin-like complex subunit 3 [Helianthus annuus]KAJ0782048.1 putative HAUS augmin-like complex subunit 3 [Helianthus annuus]KAJ0808506.1 putative HAUS augmin-like complex subunit 3 [Helianthus annuus]KAJ0946544.1 putative HAUS augmin-like complex subunit 3 [Helianthus annuus]